MTTIEALKKKHNRSTNVRKGLNAFAFLAPMTAPVPEAITDAGGSLKEISAEYIPLGLVTTDGMTHSADANSETVEALGYAEAVRTDLTKAPKTVKFTVLEPYRKGTQALVYGIDLSQAKASKTTGEIVFDEAAIPALAEYRLLTVMADGPADDEWIVGRCYPRVKLNTIPDEKWTTSDAIQFDLEFAAFMDETAGTSCRHYIGGSGAIKHRDAIGFEQAN
ncbi:hypothetical protein [Kytococcus sedentarius]|uniref:hypothetical protein n=1 Tax=Kytococcus sedentarius TaxID=1276 RepID=UPI00065F85E9|nr:hypothetical protein [Kytococcus sedentarius]